MDLPGHGLTRAPEHFTNYDDILGAVLAFIDHLLPGQRFAVVGMSAGGHVARGLVHKRAQSLTGVMFNAAAMQPLYAQRQLPDHVAIREDSDFAAAAGDAADKIRDLQPVCDVAMAGWYHRNLVPARALMQEPFASNSWRSENYPFSFAVHPLAQPFEEPSLILCGRQDTVVGYRDAIPLIEDYPRATFATLDLGGHILQPARPDLFRALVVDWLDRVSPEGT